MNKDKTDRTTTTKRRKAPARKPRPKRPEDAIRSYPVAIESWSWDYSFGLAFDKASPDPYAEYRHLTIRGHLIDMPDVKAATVELTFLPGDLDRRHSAERGALRTVGSLHLWRGRLTGLITMPRDALPPILTMLAAGKFHVVDITAARLHYGRAMVNRFRIAMTRDDEDGNEAAA